MVKKANKAKITIKNFGTDESLKTSLQVNRIIDPYIPIQVKFGGDLPSWEDNRNYVRFVDMKYSMLEVGFNSETGVIRSVTLVSAKNIHINEKPELKFENCEDGIIVFNNDGFDSKCYIDIFRDLVVYTYNTDVILSFSDDEVVKFVQNGVVKFGLNKLDELCCFVVSDFTEKEMRKLNGCLEYLMNI